MQLVNEKKYLKILEQIEEAFFVYNYHNKNCILDAPRKEIYFLGIIDVLTPYSVKKQAARAAKTVKYGSDADGISTVEPDLYAKRFMEFVSNQIE